MIGNVNNIVESLYVSDNVRTQQNTASAKTGNFSNYLDLALSNYRTGLLTGGLGLESAYLNSLSGFTWQTAVLETLKEELKKNQKSEDASSSDGQEDTADLSKPQKKPADWAKIRVIRHYKAPIAPQDSRTGILV